MRTLLATLLVLAFLGWLGCVLPSTPTAADTAGGSATGTAIWRRTEQGWERADQWPSYSSRPVRIQPAAAPVHPLIIAGLILTASLTAMAALSSNSQPSSPARRSVDL